MFSVVIIARNESDYIEACIQSALRVSDDVVLIDSGSTDDTVDIARKCGARIYEPGWMGYGGNKNFGNAKAINDWIISIDGDEIISEELVHSLKGFKPQLGTVYQLNSMVNYAGSWIKHSGWYPRWKHRIFNRRECQWNDAPVHEDLIPLHDKKVEQIKGDLLHYSYKSVSEHRSKVIEYARLKATKSIRLKKSPSLAKRYLGAYFNFIKTYFIRAGFLDGKAGWTIARMDAMMVKEELKAYDSLVQIPPA